MERVLALLLAGTLVAPQITLASESELNNLAARQAASKFSETIPLPPVPYLDTMPSLKFGSALKGPGSDTLWLPHFAVPAIPKNSAFASNGGRNAEPSPSSTTAAN